MSSANALYLLADHVKLSLLERQRAKSLDLEADSQDGHIARSLDQFRDGLEALEKERQRLEEAGDESKALNVADALPALQKQFDELTAQFHGFANPASSATTTQPNNPSLASDFAHATTVPPSSSSSAAAAAAKGSSLRRTTSSTTTPGTKSVRFQDHHQPSPSPAGTPADDDDDDDDPSAAALFSRYRDDPAVTNNTNNDTAGYRDSAAAMDNAQVHAYHSRILAQQDDQLDELGASISRQRELSMQIGDELDDHVAMLEEGERLTDRHQGRLDRARRSVGKIARGAGESKQMMAIIVLIIILVLLIAILK